MSQTESIYYLGNTRTRFQSEAYSLEVAKQYVAKIPESERAEWVAWSSAHNDWRTLPDCKELFAPIAPVLAPKPMPMPAAQPVTREERRKHPRFPLRLRVIIRNDQLTFRTFTKDISLGGVNLENAIPSQLFGEDCQIFIAEPHFAESIRFTLKASARPDLRHFSFASLEPAFVSKLQIWLNAFEESSRKTG